MRFNLLTGCLLSLGVHAGMCFFTPDLSFNLPIQANVPTDAELVELEVPLPPALQPRPPAPLPAHDEVPLASSGAVEYDATKIAPPNRRQLEGAIEKMSAGVSAQLPGPSLRLPALNVLEDTALPELPPPSEPSPVTAALLEQSLHPTGLTAGVDKQVGWGNVSLGDKQTPSRLGLPKLDQRLAARTLPAQSPVPGLPAEPSLFGIQGPAAKREPLHRPPLPKVHVQVESDIKLKFWVRPDGVVSRILPVRKGETSLEAAAIRYLEGWRFTPLPSYEPQVEQWGTITVRFLLPER